MKKSLLILIFLVSLSNADYMDKNGNCVKDYFYGKFGFSNIAHITYSNGEKTYFGVTLEDIKIIASSGNNYEYRQESIGFNTAYVCALSKSTLGLTSTQFNFLMALTGILIGFVWLFFSIQIVILIGGRK